VDLSHRPGRGVVTASLVTVGTQSRSERQRSPQADGHPGNATGPSASAPRCRLRHRSGRAITPLQAAGNFPAGRRTPCRSTPRAGRCGASRAGRIRGRLPPSRLPHRPVVGQAHRLPGNAGQSGHQCRPSGVLQDPRTHPLHVRPGRLADPESRLTRCAAQEWAICAHLHDPRSCSPCAPNRQATVPAGCLVTHRGPAVVTGRRAALLLLAERGSPGLRLRMAGFRGRASR
jgi:hypothetical protein